MGMRSRIDEFRGILGDGPNCLIQCDIESDINEVVPWWKQKLIGILVWDAVCPKVFEMDNDSIAEVVVEVITPENENYALEAKDECPVSAIIVD